MKRLAPILALLLAQPVQAAWTHVNSEGASEKVNDASFVLNPSTNPAADSIVVVVCNSDNPDNAGPAETTFHTITDDQGNSWTRLMEYQGTGNANATLTTSVWASKLTSAITGNITCTLGSSRAVKNIVMSEFTVAAGNTFSLAGTDRTDGSSGTPSATISGLSSADYLYIGAVGTEGPSGDSFTDDGGFTQNARTGTTGGGAAGNGTLNSSRNISSATTGDTYAPSVTSRDWVDIIVALEEVTAPTDDSLMVIQ